MSAQTNTTLAATLERHRASNLQTFAKKLAKLEAGYLGDVNFTDGSPGLFWIYKPSPGLSMLQDYLQIIYGDRVGDGGGEGLGTGSPVLARYIADGRYYRARVQQVMVKEENNPRESMYSVFFVDYGNSQIVSGVDLLTWDTRLEELPEQAVECCLEGAPVAWREGGGVTWTLEQMEAFQRTLRRGEVKVQLRKELGREEGSGKVRFEVLVWLEGESLLNILKRQSVFADDLASWEPSDQGLESARNFIPECLRWPERERFLKKVNLNENDVLQFGGGLPVGGIAKAKKDFIANILINRAAFRITKEKYKKALDDVTAVLSILPGQKEAIVKCVECYLALGNLREASAKLGLIRNTVIRSSYAAKMEQLEKEHLSILDLMNQELYELAIGQITLARKDYPKSWTLKLFQAECQAMRMKISKAKKLLLSLYNDGIYGNAHYLFVHGLCCYRKNNLSDASKKFSEAKLVASESKSQVNRILTKATLFEQKSISMIKVLEDAENEKKQGNKHKALIHYTSALSLDKTNEKYLLEVHLSRAGLYKEMGKYKAAVYDYEKAIEISPDCSEAWSSKGEVHMETGNFKEAINDFWQACKFSETLKNHANTSENSAKTLENRANLRRARRLLKNGGKLSHYDILGINRNATHEQIRNAYHNKAKQFHPDKNMNAEEDDRQRIEAMMKNVTAAQRCLSDPMQKIEYDRKLDLEEDEDFEDFDNFNFKDFNDGVVPDEVIIIPNEDDPDVKESRKKVEEWLRKCRSN